MDKKDVKYQAYIHILEEELVSAMGCTEPIALAYAASKARDVLGCVPDKIHIEACGSIIKNVKSVIVPNTNKLKGMPAAVVAGIIAGKTDKILEVISSATEEQIAMMKDYLDNTDITIDHIDNGVLFDLSVTVYKGSLCAKVRIAEKHANIVYIEKDGEVLFKKEVAGENAIRTDRNLLNMESIWDFSQSVDIQDIREILDRQIAYNYAIAEEGIKNEYGANIGKVLLKSNAMATGMSDVATRAKAMAAAGSDARMNGCEMPVVINSGSGNQGITVSVPVIVYARELQVDDDTLYRALVLSNLAAIHQKTGIGVLSAYCGAVNAGAAAGAAIAYLNGGGYEEVTQTLINSLAIISGMICDGAKASCAAKIAQAVDSGIFGYDMYKNGQKFCGGDGIVTTGVEKTIKNVCSVGKEGMKETNEVIIRIMIDEQ